MTTIIRSDLVISETYKLIDATQVAPGVKISVLPGATLDLGGFELLNYGTIALEGDTAKFAVVKNGIYSTKSTSGSFITNYGNIKDLTVDGFFSEGYLEIVNSLVETSQIDALQTNSISKSIFKSSPLNFGIRSVTVDQVTFSESKISVSAWVYSPYSSRLVEISNSNFIGITPVIYLDPFFSGSDFSHNIKITDSYIRIPSGSDFESMVYDATDDLRVTTDLVVSGFLKTPVTNSSTGFTVGSYTYPPADLLSTTASADTAAPTITTFSPADEAAGVGVASNIILTFSELVVARSGGTIELMTDYSSGHQSVEVFAVSDATRVMISGNVVTIDPTSALLPSTGYHLGFNNALADNAGNAFSYTHGQYNFTTTAAVTEKTVSGTTGNDILTGGAGNDTLDGGAGTDTAVFSGNRTSYTTNKTSTGWAVSSTTEGVDTLTNVERLKFADTAIALDTSGVGGQTYRVYKAAFNRTPDVGGLGFWISGMDGGVSLNAVAQGFVNSTEFKTVYGASPTNAQIVTRFYDNVLGRAADSGGYNYWLGILDAGQSSVAQVLASFSESSENQAAVIGVIGNGVLYTPYG